MGQERRHVVSLSWHYLPPDRVNSRFVRHLAPVAVPFHHHLDAGRELTNLYGPAPIDALAPSLCRMDEAEKFSMEFRPQPVRLGHSRSVKHAPASSNKTTKGAM